MSRRPPAHWYGDVPVPWHAGVLEGVYRVAIPMHRWLYRTGLLCTRRAPVPVIVVGNLTAGGSGKTPFAIALVERLKAAGWTPGIASRGYGRRKAGTPRWVERDTDASDGGDEPVLIARRTGALVRVDRRRADAAQALAAAGCDVVVCDDGLQHHALARDVDIEVIDGRRRYGNGRLLPAGPLREPATRVCDFRVVNSGTASMPGTGFGEWAMRLAGDQARPLLHGRVRPLSTFAGQRVHAVAGIGDPERFFSMLRAAGIAVVPHAFDDHHRFVPEDLAFSPLPVLVTEKDAVKLTALGDTLPHRDRIFVVPVCAELPEAFWIALFDALPARTTP